ncbi:MAG: type II toxin-antitoxin system VapC family toxin [Deltaproteobacteria bacterium]|jgi:predicted nucleic acid-binding protein|nr:type II toxin-antitoxin system VapC family toxin [Deltaproteobacteria bacterium]
MSRLLFDTNILIDYLKNCQSIDYINSFINNDLFISYITKMELLAHSSLSEEEKSGIQIFLTSLNIIPMNEKIERIAIDLRMATTLKLPDAIIVATALVIDATILTRDKRLLALKWPGLVVRSPYLQ